MQNQSGPPTAHPTAAKPRVLCIDDEIQVLEGLKLLLGRHYDVHSATDGAQGLRTLGTLRFSVVICDMRMPGISGAEFMERAASAWPATVGIILSGASDFCDDGAERGVERAFRQLNKPCDPNTLRATVAEAFLHHQNLLREGAAPAL